MRVKAVGQAELEEIDARCQRGPGTSRALGDYFEFLRIIDPDGVTVYVANNPRCQTQRIDRDAVWHQRKELDHFLCAWDGHVAGRSGTALGTPHEREHFILEVVTQCNLQKLGDGATNESMLREFAVNSQSAFEQTVHTFLEGRDTYDLETYDLGLEDYSHVKHFGWIYATELELLRRILAAEAGREVLVLDDATGFGHFILTAAHVLSARELKRVRFIGTDNKLKDMRFAMEAAAKRPGLRAEWLLEDINSPSHADRLCESAGGRTVDLLVANHVLEHLGSKTPTDYILEWLQVARAVVLTVPLEDGLHETISSHCREFSVEGLSALAQEIENHTGGAVTAGLGNVRGGMVVFQRSDCHSETQRAADLFGWAPVLDIRRVYSSVWGCDAYRARNRHMVGTTVAAESVLGTLVDIAERDECCRQIARELAEALRYTRAVTDDENRMWPVEPREIREVASRWRANQELFFAHAMGQNLPEEGFEAFGAVWAEWTTYLGLIEAAQTVTGRRDVDSFEGIAPAVVEAAHPLTPGRSRCEVEGEWARQAHRLYELADLVGLKTVHKLMRLQPKAIGQMLREGQWETLLQWVVLARLHGEGNFYQRLKLYLDEFSDPEVATSFWSLVEQYLAALAPDYRTGRSLLEVDLQAVGTATGQFMERAVCTPVTEDFDFDEAWLKARQKGLRLAEAHLEAVELAYAQRLSGEIPSRHPADLYKEAMLSFLDSLDRVSAGEADLGEALDDFRSCLLKARRASDERFSHDYGFWSGPGEHMGQVRSRALHPRYQLYQMEAYAERMFIVGRLVYDDLLAGALTPSGVKVAYERRVEFDESGMYVREWIANFGPRRFVIFGCEAPRTIPENHRILARDAWIRETRLRLIKGGADLELWGPLATGYTERLRALLQQTDDEWGQVAQSLESLLCEGDVAAFTRVVRDVSPYKFEGTVAGEDPPAVTVGLHIHNAQPAVIAETLVHMRELDWPQATRWCVIGSTSSNRAIAKEEHRLALDLGISRLGMTNRQLLKGGNQNRTMFNAPQLGGRESFYLTLDDDEVSAPLTLQRVVPSLLRDKTAAFVQVPLFFKALTEPGHSIGRQMDAAVMLAGTGLTLQVLNDPAISLPFGSNTLFRMTPGKSAVEATGGMLVDPSVSLTAEDFAFGVLATLMRSDPESYAQVQGSWTEGIFLNETWVVGDGVDFTPGGQLQKARWADGHVRVLRSLFVPQLTKRTWPSRLGWNPVLTLATILTGYPSLTAIGTLIFLLYPILAFTPAVTELTRISSYWLWAYLTLFWILPTALDLYFFRNAGLTLRDLVGITVLLFYGTYLSILKATFQALILPPGRTWGAFKGRRSSRGLQITHLVLGLFHVAAALAGLWQGLPIFALYFVSGAGFFSLWGFHRWEPETQRERIVVMARDAKETPWKRLTKTLSFPRGRLGLDTTTALTQARRIWLAWTLLVMVGIAGLMVGTGFAVLELPLLVGLIACAVSFSLTLIVVRRVFDLWLVMRGLEYRGSHGGVVIRSCHFD